MSFTQVGTCPRCGAPIYVPMMWHAIVPPPNQYTCACFPQAVVYSTNTISIQPPQVKKSVNAKGKKLEDNFKKTIEELGDTLESELGRDAEIEKLKTELEETKALVAKLLLKVGPVDEVTEPKKEILKG